MTTESTTEPTPAPAAPAEPTVLEVLQKAVSDAEAEVQAATAKLIAARAKLSGIPSMFHSFSLSAIKAEVEGWFAKL